MKTLSDRIWETRKCHINAESRLNRISWRLNLLLTAYSLYLIIASVVAIKQPLPHFEIVSLCGSILVLIASVFGWGLRLSERAGQFKSSYIRLALLIEDAALAEKNQDAVAAKAAALSYSEILQGCENHSVNDHLELRFSMRNAAVNSVAKVTAWDNFRYRCHAVCEVVIWITLFVCPLVGLYIYVRSD